MRRTFLGIGIIVAGCIPGLVIAHGFGQKIDLPVPLYLYLFGGGAVVAFSFIVLGLLPGRVSEALHTYPVLNLSQFRWFRILSSSVVVGSLKALFVAALFVALGSGFFGNQNPAFNLLPTLVWVLFAVGVTFISAFVGNIWAVVNPFKTLYEFGESVLRASGITWNHVRMPEWWGVWPAMLLFFLFRWIENVSLVSSEPKLLASFILMYAALTFAGMSVFGKDEWLLKGDPFSAFFSFLSMFSITEARKDGAQSQVYLRPPAVGLLRKETSTSGMLFVLLMLSTVAADGVLSTPLFQNLFTASLHLGLPWYVVGTAGLLGLYGVFTGVYFLFSFLTKAISRDTSSTLDVARRFVYSLLPISIAYEVAHYVSILVIEGQRIFYLVSDPLGRGWNLFGTAHYEIQYTALNLKILWNAQVGLVVVGHIIAVFLSHVIARRYFGDDRKALVSQYPMLMLMIMYSVLSLWIMAQPIVAVE